MIKRILHSIKKVYSGNIENPSPNKNNRINNLINILDDDKDIQQKTVNKYEELKKKHSKQNMINYEYDDYKIKANE